MTPFLCTNCGFWQTHFAAPMTCPVCTDFRHTPPEGGFTFLPADEVARTTRCAWAEDDLGVVTFQTEPSFGIGPHGYLIPHPTGNVFFDGAGWYSPEALDLIAARGGLQWLSASHPHAYGALWQLQSCFEPTVAIQAEDLPWTGAFAVTRPFDDCLELAPGLTLWHTGGHFPGHTILHWAERRALFAGDMIKFHHDGGGRLTGLSTHKAFNRRIPMSHAEIRRYRVVVAELNFDRVYTTFESDPCDRAQVLRLFDAQLAGPPFFGPLSIEGGAA